MSNYLFFYHYFYYLNTRLYYFFETTQTQSFIKFKPYQKKVSFYTKKKSDFKSIKTSPYRLVFGNSFFYPKSILILSTLFLTRFTLFFKRIIKKKDKSLRKFWLTPKTLLKITKQSKGARMGKGKGKNFIFIQRFPPFRPFVEFLGVRNGRLLFYLKKLNSKMPVFFSLKTNRTFNKLSSNKFIK